MNRPSTFRMWRWFAPIAKPQMWDTRRKARASCVSARPAGRNCPRRSSGIESNRARATKFTPVRQAPSAPVNGRRGDHSEDRKKESKGNGGKAERQVRKRDQAGSEEGAWHR